jgi:hypothetical protein
MAIEALPRVAAVKVIGSCFHRMPAGAHVGLVLDSRTARDLRARLPR